MKATATNLATLTATAVALFAAFAPAIAAEGDEVTELTKPTSSVEVGVGNVSKDNQRFGQYTGQEEKGGYGLLDLDYVKRDDATGTWFRFSGRNVGLDNRELRFEQNRQGDWGYFIDYSQTPRFDPFTVTTRLGGIGTNSQTLSTINPLQETHLKTERKTLSFGFDKTLLPGLGLQVRLRNEEKDGARLWGQGTFSTWRFLADPIDQTTRQADATLNYTTERLQLSGGYYGSWFDNKNNALTVLANGAASVVFNPMALPPDNSSHQLHLAGGYNFTKTMRGTFKVAYGRITQEDTFPTTAAVARSNLGGQVDTSLVQLGLTAKPMPKLTLRADLNYQNRDDKTPVFVYWPTQAVPSTSGTNDGANEPRDIKTTTGKFEAAYRLPMGFRVKGGIEYQQKTRNSPPVRSVDFREKTDETTYNVELRRSVSETVTGAVSLLHGKRDGSDWLPMIANDGTSATSALIAPLHLIDRKRDTVRLIVNWMPADPLSLNFRADESRDKYTGRGIGGFDLGPRKGRGSNYSVDAAYSFSERISGTVWVSRNENVYEDAVCSTVGSSGAASNTCAALVWAADLRNIADTYGLGLRGKVSSKLELGADVTDAKVRDEINLIRLSTTAVAPVPNINTKVTTFKLYGKYALDSRSGIRVDYIHDRYRTDDWTWANWSYSTAVEGGTTVLQNPNQKVDFIGVAYFYRWQ